MYQMNHKFDQSISYFIILKKKKKSYFIEFNFLIKIFSKKKNLIKKL